MKYNRIPGTDLDVSAACMGTMRFAAKQQGDDPISRDGENVMRRALDRGINFFHSSYQYKTRWVMSRVLADHPKRNDVHHIIKVISPNRSDGGVFKPEIFRTQVEDALRELHTERISVVQWLFLDTDPAPDEKQFLPRIPALVDEMMDTVESLRKEGKVGHIVGFARTQALRKALVDTGRLRGMVARYSLLNMEVFELFDQLKARDMSLIPIEPIYAGMLTDKRRDRTSLPEGDKFADSAGDYERLEEILSALGDSVGNSLTSFAIRFSLASSLIPSVAVSLNTPDQVDQIAAFLEEPLPAGTVVDRAWGMWKKHHGL